MSIKNQNYYNMKTYAFYQYLPLKRATANTPERFARVRQLVWNFKNGRKNAQNYMIDLVSSCFTKWYGEGCKDIVLVCVPTANERKYTYRFRKFTDAVCARTGVRNGTAHITIAGERSAKHTDIGHVVRESEHYLVFIDEEFFRGKTVIVFDDIRTTGRSSEAFAAELQRAGAAVKGGLFLAQSILNA